MATVLILPVSLSEQANALFDARIAAEVADKDAQGFVAIDVDSGDYETNPVHNLASSRLQARHPHAKIFVRRVRDECAYETTGGTLEW